MSSLALMTHRCTTQRNTPIDDGGLLKPRWADVATNVRCLVQEGPGTYFNSDTGQYLQYSAIAFFPSGTDLRPSGVSDDDDRIKMTSPSRLANVLFAVKFVADESGRGDHLTVYLQRLPGS